MSDLVGNPEDWFSHVAAQMIQTISIKSISMLISVNNVLFNSCGKINMRHVQ